MKTKKSIAVLLIAAALSAACLSACESTKTGNRGNDNSSSAESTPETSEAETKVTSAPEIKNGKPVECIDLNKYSTSSCWYSHHININDEIICCVFQGSENSGANDELRFFNIYDGKELANIPLENNYHLDSIYRENDASSNVLISFGIYTYNDNTLYNSSTMKIFKDYTYEIEKGKEDDYNIVAFGKHKLCRKGDDLIDADTNEVLIKGSCENGETSVEIPVFDMEIDDNRFLYYMGLWEGIGDVGIYDITTKKTTVIPEIATLSTIGIYNGKIYSIYSAYSRDDYDDKNIYVTDIETLETTKFFKDDDSIRNNEFNYVDMSDDGKHILISSNGKATLIDIESGEILKTFSSDEDPDLNHIDFFNNDLLVHEISCRTNDKLYFIDISEFNK